MALTIFLRLFIACIAEGLRVYSDCCLFIYFLFVFILLIIRGWDVILSIFIFPFSPFLLWVDGLDNLLEAVHYLHCRGEGLRVYSDCCLFISFSFVFILLIIRG